LIILCCLVFTHRLTCPETEMNGINTSNYGGANAYSASSCSALNRPGSYELNAKEFGPVVATSELAGDAVSAVGDLVDTVARDAKAAENTVGEWAQGATDGLSSTLRFVEQKAASAASSVSGAAASVGSAVGTVASEVGSAVGTVADYATSAVALGANALDALI
jgi:hypothetical protein